LGEIDGRLSGVTEIYYHPERPHVVEQEVTGVLEAERGRGLGKWLKTDMLLFIKEQHPDVEFISKGNATADALNQ
jgi:mycothiol synthase